MAEITKGKYIGDGYINNANYITKFSSSVQMK